MDDVNEFQFEELKRHIGHFIVCVSYGIDEIVDVALECQTCHEVLYDVEKYPQG